MSKTNITIIVLVLLIVIGGIFYLERGGEQPDDMPLDDPQATTTQSTSTDASGTSSATTFKGEVVNFDASQAVRDGPYVITVRTADGERTVEVPSMGSQTCAASSSIDMSDLSVGQTIAVSGSQERGVIVPCESADHYLRVEGGSADGQGQADDTGASVIGTSAGGNDITAHTFGNGETRLLFVAGLHGGYEWNTIKLADRMIGWFEDNPSVIPDSLSVTVIPNMNPDGLETTTGTTSLAFNASDVADNTVPGRFNANNVDLNRNFDCNWQSEGMWQNRTVNGGSSAFSEPESQALRDWVNSNSPDAAVVFYSAAGAVYSSACNGEPSTASTNLMNTYAQASGYPAEGEFDAYEITGDAVDWMAKEGVPGISVLLSNHQDVQWDMNRAGVEVVLQSYAQ